MLMRVSHRLSMREARSRRVSLASRVQRMTRSALSRAIIPASPAPPLWSRQRGTMSASEGSVERKSSANQPRT